MRVTRGWGWWLSPFILSLWSLQCYHLCQLQWIAADQHFPKHSQLYARKIKATHLCPSRFFLLSLDIMISFSTKQSLFIEICMCKYTCVLGPRAVSLPPCSVGKHKLEGNRCHPWMLSAQLAQLVEQEMLTLRVVSSSPTAVAEASSWAAGWWCEGASAFPISLVSFIPVSSCPLVTLFDCCGWTTTHVYLFIPASLFQWYKHL